MKGSTQFYKSGSRASPRVQIITSYASKSQTLELKVSLCGLPENPFTARNLALQLSGSRLPKTPIRPAAYPPSLPFLLTRIDFNFRTSARFHILPSPCHEGRFGLVLVLSLRSYLPVPPPSRWHLLLLGLGNPKASRG